MKLFAIVLLVAAVAAEDASRSARSLVGLGHGWGHGVAVASPAVWAPAPVVVAAGHGVAGPAVWGHGAVGPAVWGPATWGHGLAGHGALLRHRRSIVGAHGLAVAAPLGHVAAVPVVATHQSVWSHGVAGPAVWGHGLAGPAVWGHGLAGPAAWGHGIAGPAAWGHGIHG